jgi:type IV pilus assembly protein PilM
VNPVIVGLDIGTNCVRVSAIEPGVPPILQTFGQVALPNDAVRNGEVVDSFAVTTTIGRLWAELGLRDEVVRVAISGPRLIVRVMDLPGMDDEEVLASVQQQVAQIVPFPVQDAVFDFQVLGPSPEDVGPLMDRVLVAVAHRTAIERLLDAVEAAGLQVEAVDLVPLALVRSLGREAQAQGVAEAIVSLGAGTTTVVIHNAGIPISIETLPRGGRRLTELLVPDYGTFDAAEIEKRRVGVFPEPQLLGVGSRRSVATTVMGEEPAPPSEPLIPAGTDFNALRAQLAPDALDAQDRALLEGEDDGLEDLALLESEAQTPAEPRLTDDEIRQRLEPGLQALLLELEAIFDAYAERFDAPRLQRVVLTGGGSLLPGLEARVERALAIPAVPGKPRSGLDVADIGFPPSEYGRLDPYLAVPLGIAAGGLTTSRRIDLMPAAPVVVRPSRAPVIWAVMFMLVLFAGMAVATVIRQSQRANAEQALADQVVANQALQRQVDNYAETASQVEETDAVRNQVLIQLSYDVGWSRIMQELSVTTPGDVFLTAFQGTSTAPGSSAPGVAPLAPGTKVTPGVPSGGVTINGAGAGFPSVAAWLQRVTEVKALSNTWITNAVRTPTPGGDVVVFSAAASLTPDARSNRLAKEQALNEGLGR